MLDVLRQNDRSVRNFRPLISAILTFFFRFFNKKKLKIFRKIRFPIERRNYENKIMKIYTPQRKYYTFAKTS